MMPSITQHQKLPSSPLDIPEILEKIHSYIDEHTIRRTIILVCRQWLLINRRHITQELVWENHHQNDNLDKAIPRMPYISRIRLYFRSLGQSCRIENQRWYTFFQTLEAIHSQRPQHHKKSAIALRDQDHGTRLMVFEPTPILDFDIGGTYPNNRILDLIPFLSHVTRLRIDQYTEHYVYPCMIFQGCPRLQYLSIGSRERVFMHGEWLPSPPDQQQQQPFNALRSLILQNAYLVQHKLEEFLEFTPHLTDLHLSALMTKGRSSFIAEQRYDCRALIATIKSLNVPLKTFHFSVHEDHVRAWDALVDEELFKSICQDSREWTFATSDLTPQLMRNIQHLPNTLTTLNLIHHNTAYCSSMPDSTLQEFLCTSPQLLHLRISNTTYHMSYLDLYHRIPSVIIGDRFRAAQGVEAARHPEPGVWACRGLLTLHITFQPPGCTMIRPEHTRVVFGYIAKVCPRLIELKLHVRCLFWTPPSRRYKLAGGLCLLAGLKNLERLQIGAAPQKNVDKLHDLDWMASPRNSSEQGREKRRRVISRWNELLLTEAHRDSKLQKRLVNELQRYEGKTLGWEYCDEQLREDLRRLGLLLDVKLMMERIDGSLAGGGASNFECWPNIKRFNFGGDSVFGLVSTDQELQRLFPDFDI